VYFDAAANWLKGALSREEALSRIRINYQTVIDHWTEVAS
jgi:myo-inositol catabolism protein IolC